MNNDYAKLFLEEIAGILVIFLLGYIGSLIYNWFGLAWMIVYVVIIGIIAALVIGKVLGI